MLRFRTAGLGGLLTLVLVACSSNSGASTAATPSPTPEATPTEAATPTQAASQAAIPSFQLPSNAKELEALLPDTLGGNKLTKASMKGSDFVNTTGAQNPELVAWLNSLGKSLNDISAAYAFDISGTTQAFIFAFRVAGVDHTTLFNAFQTEMNKDPSTAKTFTSATVGGKSVQEAAGDTGNSKEYIYGAADVIFIVEASDPKLADEALSHLP